MKTFFVIGIALIMVHAAFSCICTKPKPGEEVCGSDGKTCKKNLFFFVKNLQQIFIVKN